MHGKESLHLFFYASLFYSFVRFFQIHLQNVYCRMLHLTSQAHFVTLTRISTFTQVTEHYNR